MTPEERAMLEETRNAVLENTKLLQKMQRAGRTNRILQYFYWGFIVFGSLAAVYLGQLYIDSVNSATAIGDTTAPANATTGTGVISNLSALEQELKSIGQ